MSAGALLAGWLTGPVSVYGSGGTSPSLSRSVSPSASPSRPPSSVPPSSTPPSAPSCGHTWDVTDSTGLKTALGGIAPGDTVHLADGPYADQFVITRVGTEAKPITSSGGAGAVLSDPLFNPGATAWPQRPGRVRAVAANVPYGNLTGFTVTGSKRAS